MLEFLFEFLAEVVLQLVFEVLAEVGLRSLAAPFRNAPIHGWRRLATLFSDPDSAR